MLVFHGRFSPVFLSFQAAHTLVLFPSIERIQLSLSEPESLGIFKQAGHEESISPGPRLQDMGL